MEHHRKGFTLTELLVVITIIGLLSSIATVSFTSSRMKGRDGRRLADMDTIRKGLEIYNIDNGGYPTDRTPGGGGITLGPPDASRLTEDGGWTSEEGMPIINNLAANPKGGGVDYIYYSLDEDGSNCDRALCDGYRVEFELEAPLVGYVAGPYLLTPDGVRIAPPELGAKILARSTTTLAGTAAQRLDPALRAIEAARQATIGNPAVQTAAQNVVAPVSTAAVAVSTASGLSSLSTVSSAASAFSATAGAGSAASAVTSAAGAAQSAVTATAAGATAMSAMGQVGALFYLILTQPFLLLRKKKEYAWGVVYDSQKKLPVDLAIVRLVDDATGRVMQTRVTDKAGRIFFFVAKGGYRIEATKPGYVFPSRLLSGERQDGKFANLYFGQKFTAPEQGQVVNPSIPLDPVGIAGDDKDFIKRFVRGKIQHGVSLAGFVLTIFAFTAKPGWFVGGLLALNVILYFIFRRILHPKQPAEWGTVNDEKTRRPIAHAVVRLFSSPYNKLVETRVTDRHGRYNFLVGQNIYYLTATSHGYWKTESFPIDLRESDKPQIISAPVSMRPLSETASPEPEKPKPQPETPSS